MTFTIWTATLDGSVAKAPPDTEEHEMNRSSDRSKDPSPFAWIFGGVLALLAAGSLGRALTSRRREAASGLAAGASGVTTTTDATTTGVHRNGGDADLAGHPS